MECRRVTRALTVCALAVALLMGVSSAHAADAGLGSAPGSAALRQARAAWERGASATAEPFYRDALERGGLAPNEVLEGYVRLGVIRGARGKKDSALAAFRAASILDANFDLPKEATRAVVALANRAKKETRAVGSLYVRGSVPDEVVSGRSFKVSARIDAAHLPIITKIVLLARDGTSGRDVTLEAKPQESVEFEVPPDVTLPNAMILVHVDALDAHDNRLESYEARVKVPDAPAPAPAVAVVAVPPVAPAASTSVAPVTIAPSRPPGADRKRGFWATPWPYVIGGAALVGAGAAIYIGTRSPGEVSVGQVGVHFN